MTNNPLQPRFTLPCRLPVTPPKKKKRRGGIWFLAILGEIVLLALFLVLGTGLFFLSISWTLRLVGWILLLILWSNGAASMIPLSSPDSPNSDHTPLAENPAFTQNTTGFLQVITKEQLETYAKIHGVYRPLSRNQWHRAGISHAPPPRT